MIRPDIESLYFTSNGEVSDCIRFIKLYNWNNWPIHVQIVQIQYMLISKDQIILFLSTVSFWIQNSCSQGEVKETLHENVSRLHQFLVCLNKKFPIKIMSHALFPYNVNRIQLSKIPHNLVDRTKILSYEKKFHWRKSVEFNYLKSPMTWLVV